MKETALLFMAAGKSSRFGGTPKLLCLLKENRTLFEVCLLQIQKYLKITHIHMVVNTENEYEIMKVLTNINDKHNFCDKITSNLQLIPRCRKKPWGTAEALAICEPFMEGPFLLLNSDDLYSEETFECILKNCQENKNYVIGFQLGNTLKNDNKANRAFIEVEENNKTIKLEEKMNLCRKDFTKEKLDSTYVSVNLFYLQPNILTFIREKIDKFKFEHLQIFERTKHDFDDVLDVEALLPDFINELIKENKIYLELLKSPGDYNGVTYKTDVQYLQNI